MSSTGFFSEFEAKMNAAGIKSSGIRAFGNSYQQLISGHTGMIPESSIEAVSSLPDFNEVTRNRNEALLSQVIILKLNGGLGTGMGLEGPKSLLPIKEKLTFLDFIARQILHLRKTFGVPLRFLLMNSFGTSPDTLAFLRRYPEIGPAEDLEVMQGTVPKVDARTMRPISWPANPQLEWCPPGHGDLYPSLLGSGWLDRLLGEGVRFMFVSNADNLGASLDLGLLTYFSESNQSFIMEVTERTEADKKGGHLARRPGGGLLLRESAQCPSEDTAAFQDIQRHRFFNTNNLWVRLDRLCEVLDRNGGIVPLPLIKNSKTVDPRDKTSPPVFQLETAMGAAIECFENAGAVNVPRSRFAPVKTTSDLLALRSDAYQITLDWRLELRPELRGQPPIIDLDGEHYKMVDQLDAKLLGVPSLRDCRQLRVRGPVVFEPGVVLKGNVEVKTTDHQLRHLPGGVYENQTVLL